jgi:hypothetical protein
LLAELVQILKRWPPGLPVAIFPRAGEIESGPVLPVGLEPLLCPAFEPNPAALPSPSFAFAEFPGI